MIVRPAVLRELRASSRAPRAIALWLVISFACFCAALYTINRIEDQAEENALARAEIGTQTIEKIVGQLLELSEIYKEMAQTAVHLTRSGDHIGAGTIYNHL